MLALLASCGQPPERGVGETEAAAREPTRPDPARKAGPVNLTNGWTALDDAPEDDRVWADAFLSAYEQGRLDELRERATRLSREYPDRWEPLWLSGLCSSYLNDNDAAHRVLAPAGDLARRTDDPVGIALVGHELAWVLYYSGRIDDAISAFRETVEAAERTDRLDLRARCLGGLGAALYQRGRFREALDAFEASIPLYESAGDFQNARQVRYNHTVLLREVGDLGSAQSAFEDLYEQSVRHRDRYLTALTSTALGNLHFVKEAYDSAEEWYARIPAEDKEQLAIADFNRGRMALVNGDTVTARRWLEPVSRQTDYRVIALLAIAYLAKCDVAEGSVEPARKRLVEVIAEADRVGAEEPAWVARLFAGGSWLRERRFGKAVQPLRQAVEIIERQRGELDPLAEGMRFLRRRVDPYVDLAVALAGSAADDPVEPAEAFRTIEKAHARALRRALHDRETLPVGASLEDVRSSLGDRDVVLNYLIGEERGIVIALRRDATRASPIPGRRELLAPLRRYRAALMRPLRSSDARREPEADLLRSVDAGRQLHDMLLGPVEALLSDARRLYVVPDQNLAILPFAALPREAPDGGDDRIRFLGEFVDVTTLPLAGIVPRWNADFAPILLGGDPLPDSRGRFPVLPDAGLELDLVARLREGEVKVGLRRGDLTPRRFLAQPLESFRTIHLATHAVASTADPSGCAIYMSGGKRLGLDRIVDLKLDASPLVILSACRTAEGELVPGEGVVGLTWAFLRAGAKGVLASLWSVEDTATTELMVAFHRQMRDGEDPVAALATAQREIASRYFHPAYWAPFVLVVRPELPS